MACVDKFGFVALAQEGYSLARSFSCLCQLLTNAAIAALRVAS
jgi:hypothetical protein